MLLPLLVFVTLMPPGSAGNPVHWPEYRGPSADGHTTATGLPVSWSESEGVRWKTPIHGRGWSTPVVWGDQVWFTTATPDGRKMFVVCVNKTTGRILLDKLIFENENPDPINDVNSYASPTPVIEEGSVYVHFGTYGTACLDTKKLQTVWTRRDLNIRHSVGPGSSPVLFRNLLILTFDGTNSQFTAALDKRSGNTVWKKPRATHWAIDSPSDMNERFKSFNTPLLVDWNGKPLLVSPGAQCTFGYDPQDGRELWSARNGGYSSSSRTIVSDGMAFVNTGYDHAELLGIRMGGSGDVTDSHIAWRYSKNVPFKPSAILVDGLYYMMNDAGVLTCLEAKTGAEVWKERVGGHYSASPIYAEGRIYWFSEEGVTTVTKPSRHFEKLAENRLDAGFMASPAVTGKALILRTKTHLYRIEK